MPPARARPGGEINAEETDRGIPRWEYGLHRFALLFENGHQEGTAAAITHDRVLTPITGIRCTDCGFLISWRNFNELVFQETSKTVGLRIPIPTCPDDHGAFDPADRADR